MKQKRNMRACTRTTVWPDTTAIVTAAEPGAPEKEKVRIRGRVRDIGSCGMFLETSTFVPVGANLSIEILFDPEAHSSKLPVSARGVLVHRRGEGVGIRFTTIDLSVFQKAIIEKMNRAERQEKAMYTLGPARAAAAMTG